MAVKTFEEIYSALSAQEKTLLDNVFAKEPELKGGWLRQDDYSRKQNELKSKQTEYEDAVVYKAKMEPWAENIYAKLEELKEKGVFDIDTGEELWTTQKTELEKQIEAAKALGGDMDPKQLEALVTSKVQEIAKQAGGLTREEASALYAAESKKLVEDGFKERETKFNSETIPFVAGFSAGVAVIASRYEQESGEKWSAEKQKELFDLMSREQNFDAFKVEEKLMAPIRAKKDEEKRIEERAQAIAKEKYGASGMPGGGGERYIPQPPGGDARGLLQKALEDSAGSGDKGPIDVRDSVMAGVIEGAKELQEAGKF
jgi:hypothetical protein